MSSIIVLGPTFENDKKVLLKLSYYKVLGVGNIQLVFTSGRTMPLKDVLHTPNIAKNLVSWFLLVRLAFKQFIEFDQYIMLEIGCFVGKGLLVMGCLDWMLR